MAKWKITFLKFAGFGAGFAALICLAFFGWFWYVSRPKLPKAWDTGALIAKEPPGFSKSGAGDSKRLEFTYVLENTTPEDYVVSSDTQLRLIFEDKNGNLGRQLPAELLSIQLPVFIPTKKKAQVTLSLKKLTTLPEQQQGESDDEFHERLRAFCEDKLGGISGFVLFDEAKRYEVNLPRWLSKAPRKESGTTDAESSEGKWQPSWKDANWKSSEGKKSSPRPSTLTFDDVWLRAVPVLNDETQRRLQDQERKRKAAFLQAFDKSPSCKGIDFLPSNPEAQKAGFDFQFYEGLDGRAGKYQWILYRTDTGRLLTFGERIDVKSAVEDVCIAVHHAVRQAD